MDNAAEPALMDHVVAGLWCQMLADMLIGKGPNPRSHLEASYATLDPMQQAAIDEVMYQRFTLPFLVARYRVASMSHWTTMFNRFYPPPGTTLPTVYQGFRSSRFFVRYTNMIDKMDPQHVKILRKALKDRWDTLWWMPYTGSDRMWVTRSEAGRQAIPLPANLNNRTPAPLVGLNPRFARGAYHVELGVGDGEPV